MEKQKSKGLGDSLASFTKATKLDVIVKTATKALGKEDCGCKKRQQYLNEKFPYRSEK